MNRTTALGFAPAPDGDEASTWLISAGADRSVRLWSFVGGNVRCLRIQSKRPAEIRAICYVRELHGVALIGDAHGNVWAWLIGENLGKSKPRLIIPSSIEAEGSAKSVSCMAICPEPSKSHLLAVGYNNGNLRVYDWCAALRTSGTSGPVDKDALHQTASQTTTILKGHCNEIQSLRWVRQKESEWASEEMDTEFCRPDSFSEHGESIGEEKGSADSHDSMCLLVSSCGEEKQVHVYEFNGTGPDQMSNTDFKTSFNTSSSFENRESFDSECRKPVTEDIGHPFYNRRDVLESAGIIVPSIVLKLPEPPSHLTNAQRHRLWLPLEVFLLDQSAILPGMPTASIYILSGGYGGDILCWGLASTQTGNALRATPPLKIPSGHSRTVFSLHRWNDRQRIGLGDRTNLEMKYEELSLGSSSSTYEQDSDAKAPKAKSEKLWTISLLSTSMDRTSKKLNIDLPLMVSSLSSMKTIPKHVVACWTSVGLGAHPNCMHMDPISLIFSLEESAMPRLAVGCGDKSIRIIRFKHPKHKNKLIMPRLGVISEGPSTQNTSITKGSCPTSREKLILPVEGSSTFWKGIPDAVTSILWFPRIPGYGNNSNLLVFGCSNGAIGILHCVVGTSVIAPVRHASPVANLFWITDDSTSDDVVYRYNSIDEIQNFGVIKKDSSVDVSSETNYLLVSFGTDGSLLRWKPWPDLVEIFPSSSTASSKEGKYSFEEDQGAKITVRDEIGRPDDFAQELEKEIGLKGITTLASSNPSRIAFGSSEGTIRIMTNKDKEVIINSYNSALRHVPISQLCIVDPFLVILHVDGTMVLTGSTDFGYSIAPAIQNVGECVPSTMSSSITQSNGADLLNENVLQSNSILIAIGTTLGSIEIWKGSCNGQEFSISKVCKLKAHGSKVLSLQWAVMPTMRMSDEWNKRKIYDETSKFHRNERNDTVEVLREYDGNLGHALFLISSSDDQTISLWDVEKRLEHHSKSLEDELGILSNLEVDKNIETLVNDSYVSKEVSKVSNYGDLRLTDSSNNEKVELLLETDKPGGGQVSDLSTIELVIDGTKKKMKTRAKDIPLGSKPLLPKIEASDLSEITSFLYDSQFLSMLQSGVPVDVAKRENESDTKEGPQNNVGEIEEALILRDSVVKQKVAKFSQKRLLDSLDPSRANISTAGECRQIAHRAAIIALWSGDVGQALHILLENDALTADFVSCAAALGRGPWEAAVRAYAEQLEARGEVNLAAMHLLSIDDVHEACKAYERAGMIVEAANLAALRLPHGDSVSKRLRSIYATKLKNDGRISEAAVELLACHEWEEAIKLCKQLESQMKGEEEIGGTSDHYKRQKLQINRQRRPNFDFGDKDGSRIKQEILRYSFSELLSLVGNGKPNQTMVDHFKTVLPRQLRKQ